MLPVDVPFRIDFSTELFLGNIISQTPTNTGITLMIGAQLSEV